MSSARICLTVTILTLAGTAAAWAQAPDLTGTGGGPASTFTARNTTAVGQTKPPSRAASPTSTDSPDRRTTNEQRQDEIDTGICIGCNAK